MNLDKVPIGYVTTFSKGQELRSDFMIAEGKELIIAQHPKLFKVFKNMYGGDGITTFGTPDFREKEIDPIMNSTEYNYITSYTAFKYK